MMYEIAVERTVPHSVVGKEHHLRRQRQQIDEVEVRLMITDDH